MMIEHPFEQWLSISFENIEFVFRGHAALPWLDFELNPRRLRGSDFLMRWSQGRWSEERLVQAVNASEAYFALPYGPSGTAPDDIRAFELYFERLEAAGLGLLKRPDALIFEKSEEHHVHEIVASLGGISELPFTSEDDERMQQLLTTVIVAIECENSLWQAQQMPDYGSELRPQKRLGGLLGLKKSAVLPTVIIKKEDFAPLQDWQREHQVPIHIWHAFYDIAFGIALDRAVELIEQGLIEPTEQVFQAPGGATSKKIMYKIYYHYAYQLGYSAEPPRLVAQSITDKNGHILPYVAFEGGRLHLDDEALAVLDQLAS